jgi:hypothetical protein
MHKIVIVGFFFHRVQSNNTWIVNEECGQVHSTNFAMDARHGVTGKYSMLIYVGKNQEMFERCFRKKRFWKIIFLLGVKLDGNGQWNSVNPFSQCNHISGPLLDSSQDQNVVG